MTYLTLTRSNIGSEHICCAFSDKKCAGGYAAKKRWLAGAFDDGYVFRRLDERAKVFIEYGPAEKAWAPVSAPGYLMIGCFWVSGKYKRQGHGKALLREVVQAARDQRKDGLVTVVGTTKFHFMSDTRWLLGQGFTVCDSTTSGFSLLAMDLEACSTRPSFGDSVRSGECEEKNGLVAYYSDRCPYTEFYVRESLAATAAKRGLPLTVVKLETLEQAQAAPTPATIFSLFRDGRFVTTDLGVCTDGRFDRIAG
jgi:GNAT superfamily N-acetyltransferase